MKNLFQVIEGGLVTATGARRTILCDKVIRFETPPEFERPPSRYEYGFLRSLDEDVGFDSEAAEPAGCILDFEYNGVPARRGFIRD